MYGKVIKIQSLKNEDLENIKGGTSITVWSGIVCASIIIFISGIIEGLTNPGKCGEINGYN